MTERRILCRLLKGSGGIVRASVIADEVEVLSTGCGDAERLLHETVGLVAVSIRTLVRVTIVGAIWSLAARSFRCLCWRCETIPASLAFHFPVRQETPRHSAGTP
jgi:hypothetical protein